MILTQSMKGRTAIPGSSSSTRADRRFRLDKIEGVRGRPGKTREPGVRNGPGRSDTLVCDECGTTFPLNMAHKDPALGIIPARELIKHTLRDHGREPSRAERTPRKVDPS